MSGVTMILSTSTDSFATKASGLLPGAMTAVQLSTGTCSTRALAVVGAISCRPMRSVLTDASPF